MPTSGVRVRKGLIKMTRAALAAKIRTNLNDLGITFYSVSDINESIQDAYDEIVVYSECIEKRTDINFTSNSSYYKVGEELPSDFYRVIGILNDETNRWLTGSFDRNELIYANDWETTSGTAYNFTILGFDRIGITGRKSNATGYFKMFYKAQAPILQNSTHLLINDNFILLPELYATADLLEQNQEFSKASIYWNQYDEMLEKYRDKIQLLSKSDRVFTRGG